MRWEAAEQYCVERGSHLAAVHSIDEMQFLSNLTTKHAWIGLEWKENSYQWTDGSQFNFSNWNSGEPNKPGEENCVEVLHQDKTGSHGYWNDRRCDYNKAPICKKYLKGKYQLIPKW